MKMTNIEKRFVNRKNKSERNIKKLDSYLKLIDLSKIKTVLELGCGIGFVSSYLADTYDFNVYGTDYDQGQIQIAKKLQPKHENVHFQIEDATKLSFEDSSFDLVLSQNVFHHIPKWNDAIKEISRVICPGGYFIWLDLVFAVIVKKFFLPFVRNYGLYTIDDILTAFDGQGFNKLFHEQVAHGPLSQYHYLLQHD